jgi:hypothetical protein
MDKLTLITICTLGVMLGWLSAAVVRLENYRAASFSGQCSSFAGNDARQKIQREQCLHNVKTENSFVEQLLHGLNILTDQYLQTLPADWSDKPKTTA